VGELKRFLDAQERDYATALSEITAGYKRSHWMWYIFPQIDGLGHTEMAKRFSIRDLPEATAYLQNSVLGKRLINISKRLLDLPGKDATKIMGSPDDMKLRSCMTLFSIVPGADGVFNAVIEKYFNGEKDRATLQLL
jgi:uncharacterized protein (DUF1810 family)